MDVSDDQTVSLREHLEALIREQDIRNSQRFQAQEQAVAAALTAADRAVQKAEIAAEKRFDAVNEFRGQLADQAATFMPRSEADVRFGSLAEKLDTTTSTLTAMVGKGGGRDQAWGYLVGLVGIAAGVVGLIAAFAR